MSPGSPVLVLGARSDIALATARRFAQAGHSIQLAARNCGGLERDRADIALRFNVAVTLHEFDALATDSFGAFIAALLTARPEEVAEATYRAVVGRKNTVYVRRVWGPVMTIIRALPELLFKKMSL